jgi:hypothetical protein
MREGARRNSLCLNSVGHEVTRTRCEVFKKQRY